MAVVLEEVVDDTYDPSQEEICKYAEWLGMDLKQDQGLLWIARDGLKARLPPAWKACEAEDGSIFYYNFTTGESIWDHPTDEHHKRMYRRAKARRDAPVRVVTIHGSLDERYDTLTVRCCGSLSGEQLVVLNPKSASKLKSFRSELAKQLEASKRRLRIMMPDGRVLTEDDDTSTLATVLGIDSAWASGRPAFRNSDQEERICLGRAAEETGFDIFELQVQSIPVKQSNLKVLRVRPVGMRRSGLLPPLLPCSPSFEEGAMTLGGVVVTP